MNRQGLTVAGRGLAARSSDDPGWRHSRKLGAPRRVGGLVGLVVVACQLASCGGTASPVVVRVANSTITQTALERWTAIEAAVVYNPNPTRPVPRGAIPDPPGFTGCISYLRSTGAKAPSDELKRMCENEYTVLQHQILEILITTRWLTTEAAARGIRVSDAEARRVVHEKFKTKAALQRFLTLTGEREADEVFLLKRTMLANRMSASFARPGAPPAQTQAAQAAFFMQLVKRWTALTSCSPGYVISQCRQYHAG